ncbi:MAG: isochorismatase family cysteine hydrolase [Gammaproteobacteria bacterium]
MNTAIIALDFVNDIVSKDGKIPSCAAHVEERHVIQNANVALQTARKNHWLVILVKVGFSEHYLEQPKNSPIFGKANQLQALKLNTWGTEFHPQLEISSTDRIIVKSRVSPFYATNLDAVLSANNIQRLILCGVSSTWAIQAAARDGHDRDYEIIVLEDACAAANEEEHQLSMKQLSRIAKVLTIKELVSMN